MSIRTKSPNRPRQLASASAALFVLAFALIGGQAAMTEEAPKIQVITPVPTVPEVFTLMGQFVRIAYNNEGFASLAYRMAQQEVGKEWMLLEVGITLRKPAPAYKLKREDISIQTPDGKMIPLATNSEYLAVSLNALNSRAKIAYDPLNYFPADVSTPMPLRFFADQQQKGLAYDQVELNSMTAGIGRLYFHVPGGIKVGQHWLKIRFASGPLEVPFRILTKDEEKQFSKTWQEIKKQHDESYKK